MKADKLFSPTPVDHTDSLLEQSLWLLGESINSVLPLRSYSLALTFFSTLLNGLLALVWWHLSQNYLSLGHSVFSLMFLVLFVSICLGLEPRCFVH